MNDTETKKVLAVLKAAYPSFYSGMGRDDLMGIVALWRQMFINDSYEHVSAAVRALIASKVEGYPPTIGAVREKLMQIEEPERLTAFEAWRLVMKAASDGYYHAKERFDELPEDVQRVLRSPATLREYSTMNTEQLNTVVASNFRRAYDVVQRRRDDAQYLPEDVKKMLSEVADNLQLGDGKDKNDLD